MKKKFNIYCGLLIAAIIFGIGIHAFQITSYMWYGVKAGIDAAIYEKSHPGEANANYSTHLSEMQKNITGIEMFPKHLLSSPEDSIYNIKTGKSVPFQPIEIIAMPDTNANANRNVILGSISWLTIAFMVIFWIAFIKFIITVNKGELFEQKMEKQMAWGGWSVFGIYALEWVTVLINYFLNVHEFEFADYDIIISQVPEPSLLYSAFGMLLLGQIFRIGRKMKEEQELTI